MNKDNSTPQIFGTQVEALFRREADHVRLRQTSGASGVEISVVDGLRANPSPAYKALHGLAPDIESDSNEDWLQRVHVGDRVRVSQLMQSALDGTGAGYEIEYRIVRPSDDAVRWIFERIDIERDASGQAIKLVGAEIDVTSQKQRELALRSSEERLRTLADEVPQLIWANDAHGTANYFNKRWYEYSGLTYEQSFELGWQAIVHPDDGPASTLLWEESLAAGETFDREYRLRDRDGVYRWFIGRNVPLKNGAGRVLGWFGTATEIEQLKRAQQASLESEARYRELAEDLSRTKDALLAADKQKDQFIATLAHELRNPLAPVRSAMQLISMIGSDDPQLLWALDVVNRQTNSMTRLIDDLMDVSRITQNKLTLRFDAVDLSTVLRDAMDTTRPLIEQQSQTLAVNLPSHAIHLNGDGTRLAQVFANLLDNAAKYTPPGGAITLSARVDDDLHEVEVCVKDTGIGIAPHHRERVFELFSQVRNARERGKGGLGIGLSLVKELVQMHGGSIEVKSEGADKGSEFIVRLPLGGTMLAAQSDYDDDVVLDTSVLLNTRVLVVDDNIDAADAIVVLLKRVGANVRAVYDGEAALRAAEEFAPEIVLMDIGLPKLTGHEVAEHIRAHEWGARMLLIAISGWGSEQEKRKSYAAGIDRHLVKPVEPEKLMRVMVKLLREHS